MQAGHDEGRVQGTKDGGKEHAHVGAEAPADGAGDGIADGPADGADNKMRDEDSRDERHEGHDDHAHDLGRDLGEEPLKANEHEGGHEGGDDLPLVAGAEERVEAKVVGVGGNVLRGGGCNGEAIEELRRDERETQDDAQYGRGSHLARDGPTDANGEHVEDGLADHPQEAVHAAPERPHVRDGLGAVLEVEDAGIGEEVDLADDVTEAQDETAADESRDERCKDLSEHAHRTLQRVLVCARRGLGGLLGDALDAADRRELLVEVCHVVADDHLELARLRERALGARQLLDGGNVCLLRINQHKAHARHAVGDR